MPRTCYVYIMSSTSKCLYVGMTNNVMRRWNEHRSGRGSEFCAKYRVRHLVYVEAFARPRDAIAREKQIKHWGRQRRVELICASNPGWKDLAVEWGWHRIRV